MEQHHLKSESPIPAHRLSTPSTNKKSCLHVAGGKTNHPIPVISTIGTFHLINSFSLFRRGNYENFSEKKTATNERNAGERIVSACVWAVGATYAHPFAASLFSITHICVRPTAEKMRILVRIQKRWENGEKLKKKKEMIFPRTFAFHQMVLRFGGERRKQKSITKSQQRCKSISSSFKVWLSGVAATVNPLKLS